MNSPTLSVDALIPIRLMICVKINNLKAIEDIIEIAITKLKLKIYIILYFLEGKSFARIKQQFPGLQCILVTEKDPPVDYVLTFGGDGTILYAAQYFKRKQPVFLTFDMGTLGFLCKFDLSQINSIFNNLIISKNLSEEDQFPFGITKLLRLQGTIRTNEEIVKEGELCLNQIAITRNFKSRIILELYVNNQYLTQTAGDGLLVATPCGSTAYALSAGGPVVQNGINCIIIVPISPHSLSFRPLCLHTSSVIKIKVSQKSMNACYISFDGQANHNLNIGDEITIKRSSNYLTFYEPKQEDSKLPNWTKRLKSFLNWNQPFKSNQQRNSISNKPHSNLNKSKL